MFLVSCVAAKRSAAAPARDLYISDWFQKARAYVEKQGDPWFILSAKHGLVRPDQVLQPYELTLNNMAAKERRAWAQRVLEALGVVAAEEPDPGLILGDRQRLPQQFEHWTVPVNVDPNWPKELRDAVKSLGSCLGS
jgi:hypothetical protein